MNAAQLSTPRLPPGSIVITPDIAFTMNKRAGRDVAQFGAYHASQDTRFRDFSTGGSPNNSRDEADYFPRLDRGRTIARGRVMFRNNPYFGAIASNYVQSIGTPTLKSQTADELYNDAKERFFETWSEDCEAENDFSLDQVITIYLHERIVAGEMFLIKRREGWLQLIASELCGSLNTKKQLVNIVGAKPQAFADGTAIPAGATERDGIVRSAANRIIGYRFGTRDDNGCISFAPEKSSIVQKQYVIHLFDPKRSEQGRGIPLAIAIINSLQDIGETAHARAQQVKNASCLSLWITKNIDPYGFAESMRGSLNRGDLTNVETLKEAAASRSQHQEVKAGAVMYGAAGETLQVVEPKLNAADFHDHYIDLGQIVCANLDGMPVEIGFEGFRDSTYSSSRATVNKWKSSVLTIRKGINNRFLQPVQLWQSRRAQLFGDLSAPPPSPAGSATHNTDENVRFGWPQIPDIDGAKTAAQNAIDLANGTTTRTAIYADKGEYIDEQDKIAVKEKTRLLKMYLDEAKLLGLSPAAAEAWALAQMPAVDAALLAPIIAAGLAPETSPPPAA